MKFTRLAAAAALVLSVGFANAALLPFTVTPSAYASGMAPFVADKITGNYVERVTFNGVGSGTFDVSIKWNAGQFVTDDGTTALDSVDTGLGSQYRMYSFFQGKGTFVGGVFTLGSGSLKLYLDPKRNTTFTAASSQPATTWWGVTGGTDVDDLLLATGTALAGNGKVACTGNNNCGSFGQTTSFSLTPTGQSFFTSPSPFYGISEQSGQFNSGFIPSGTLTLNGSLDVIFANVPEPGSIALVGLALVGLGFASRRKAK